MTLTREEALQWRPISTAPKDGTYILVCQWPLDTSPGTLDMFCHNVSWWPNFYGEGTSGEWVVYNHLIEEYRCFFDPTHWMSLPLPPSDTNPQPELYHLETKISDNLIEKKEKEKLKQRIKDLEERVKSLEIRVKC